MKSVSTQTTTHIAVTTHFTTCMLDDDSRHVTKDLSVTNKVRLMHFITIHLLYVVVGVKLLYTVVVWTLELVQDIQCMAKCTYSKSDECRCFNNETLWLYNIRQAFFVSC